MTDWDRRPPQDSMRDPIRDSIHDSIHDSVRRGIDDRIRNRQERMRRHQDRNPFHGVVIGGIVCLVGVVLLLDHLGYISADRLWRLWPALLILAGAARLSMPGRRAWGAMLILIGALFLLDNYSIIRFHWSDLWPLVIICVGLMMIWNAIEARKIQAGFGGPTDTQPTMTATAIFGGVERRITANDFRRGSVTAVFGGGEIDLHEAGMDGDEATLEVNAVFGGVEIRVPEGWSVEFHGQTVFGGYSDKTRVAPVLPDGPKRKTLFIIGTTCFGGVEVKN